MSKPTTRVGETLRRAREARGLSLSDLARSSKVAKATVSALEAGTANPTLDTMWALTAALGMSLGELVDPPQPAVTLRRAGEGTLVRGEAVVARLVASHDVGTERHELFDCQVLKRRQLSPAHARGVVEQLVVTAGRLRVGPVEDPVELGVGDYLRMTPAWPHLYEGLAAGTRMVLIMQFPRG